MTDQGITYSERVAEAKLMQAIMDMDTSSSEASKLQEHLNKLLNKKPKLKEAIAEADPLELESLQRRLNAAWDKHRQAQIRLTELERRQAAVAAIKVISSSGDRAQIVIHFTRDDKKVSFTRHVYYDGAAWVGFSTMTHNKVHYEISRAQLALAA